MKILVTGATGFVGNVLLKRLPEIFPDAQVSAFVFPEDPLKPSLSRIEGLRVFEGDITIRKDVLNAVKGHTHVIHLAGLISYCRWDKKVLMDVNATGVKNVVDACRENSILKLILISSVGACGFYKDGKLANEETLFNWPQYFHYMVSKHEGQKTAEQACQMGGVPTVILLPASIMGPGDPNPATPHNQLYERIYKKGLFGCFSGGVAVVDVRDLVEIILKALESHIQCDKYLVVGANVKYSDVVKAIAEHAKKKAYLFPMPAFLLSIVGGFLEFVGTITRRKPLLTYSYGRLSGWTVFYANEKSRLEFEHEYRPFEETIADSCQFFEENFLE
jgi:nucleoside-diphosphate-sugar epimerase